MPRRSQTKKDATQGVTQAGYARRRGVSREAIRKAVESGRIPTLRGGKIDPKKADAAFRENTDPSRGGKRGRGQPQPELPLSSGVPKLYISKAIREHHLAQLAKLEHLELDKQLVRIDKVKEMAFAAARKARDQLMAIPDRVAPMVTGRDDHREVYDILHAEIRKVCEELGAIPREAAEGDPPPAAAAS